MEHVDMTKVLTEQEDVAAEMAGHANGYRLSRYAGHSEDVVDAMYARLEAEGIDALLERVSKLACHAAALLDGDQGECRLLGRE